MIVCFTLMTFQSKSITFPANKECCHNQIKAFKLDLKWHENKPFFKHPEKVFSNVCRKFVSHKQY